VISSCCNDAATGISIESDIVSIVCRALQPLNTIAATIINHNFFTLTPPYRNYIMKLFQIYLLLINALAFLLMLIDKYKAKKNLWRIRESTLLLIAAIGGSIGALAGMYTFRHKTKHLKFTLGIPVILVLQIVAAYYVLTIK
jgi:uncharacterized membrane protein YsdA (DUF1294 family)